MASDLTIIIPTRNRPEVLRHSLAKIRQHFPAEPILVYDDASENADQITEVVGAFPGTCCFHGTVSIGPAGGRQELLKKVTTRWALALDDDCYPREDFDISRWLDHEPALGAAIIIGFRIFRPYDGDIAPPGDLVVGPSQGFHGGASLLHCQSVLAVGGYRDFLVFGGEDTELAYRVWASGYQVWIDPTSYVIHEHVSCARDIDRETYFYIRNRIVINILTLPLWLGLPLGSLQALRRALYHRDVRNALRGIAAGYRDGLCYYKYRKIMSIARWRWLRSLRT